MRRILALSLMIIGLGIGHTGFSMEFSHSKDVSVLLPVTALFEGFVN